tara:strand:- start:1692 stop:2249 length:558 start_codon:yes stop_codon:yes gene_type:complete
MAERLVVLSDIWGVKKGLWITSYLGYLQQYYDIVFYDIQQLANLDLTIKSAENLHKAFVNGGIDTAVAHLLKRETEASHYLAFSTGGTIAWKANLKGLPMKSLHAISSTRLRFENLKPDCDTTLVYGGNDQFRPDDAWADKLDIDMVVEPNFGHELYSDEKIISKTCQTLLSVVTVKQKAAQKVV